MPARFRLPLLTFTAAIACRFRRVATTKSIAVIVLAAALIQVPTPGIAQFVRINNCSIFTSLHLLQTCIDTNRRMNDFNRGECLAWVDSTNKKRASNSVNLNTDQRKKTSLLYQKVQAIKSDLQGHLREIDTLLRQQAEVERLAELEVSRLRLSKSQVDAVVNAAQRLQGVARAQSNSLQNPTSARAVIGAQIEGLAVGYQGSISEVEATRVLWDHKESQLQIEQALGRWQLESQQQRETFEAKLLLLMLKAQRDDLALGLVQKELNGNLGTSAAVPSECF